MANTATKFFESIKDHNEELITKYSTELTTNFGENGDLIVELLGCVVQMAETTDLKSVQCGFESRRAYH